MLERLSAPLCAALQGVQPGDSQALLEEAERRGLFLVALDDERRWYRYHTLFAEVLRAELRRETGPERLDELRQMARRLFTGLWGDDGRQTAEQLTNRERVVLELMAEGATNGEIAERLSIAVSTATMSAGQGRQRRSNDRHTRGVVDVVAGTEGLLL